MEFTLRVTVTHPAASLRAALTTWQVSKTQRHELRIHHRVLVNDQYRHFNEPVRPGDVVTMTIVDATPPQYLLAPTPLALAYADAHLLVVNKPTGIKTHPNRPDETGTLLNQVAAYLAPRPAYITHRLDMATSGLVVIARDPITQNILNRQLATKTMARSYVALVPAGLPASGTITAPIGRDHADKRKRMVRPDGAPAITHYRVISTTAGVSRVRLTLATGRTHQLRVHLAYLGFPIIGDPLYSTVAAPRLMLHADEITLAQPFTGEALTVTCPVPF